jgi:hypothetical protein
MNKITKDQSEIAQQFIDLVVTGANALADAGKLIADAIDLHGEEIIEVVCDKCPDMTSEFVKRLEAVGRNKIHRLLVINESAGVRRLRSLPFSIQEKYASNPVPLLIVEGQSVKTIQADVRNLTPAQATQVFARDHVRSEAEQRTFIEDLRSKQSAPAHNAPFRVVKNELIIIEPCRLGKKELCDALAQMS